MNELLQINDRKKESLNENLKTRVCPIYQLGRSNLYRFRDEVNQRPTEVESGTEYNTQQTKGKTLKEKKP